MPANEQILHRYTYKGVDWYGMRYGFKDLKNSYIGKISHALSTKEEPQTVPQLIFVIIT